MRRRAITAVVCAAAALAGVSVGAGALASSAPQRCPSNQLRLSFGAVSGGLSHAGVALRFTNRGPRCLLGGYPGADGISPAGQKVLSARRLRSGYLGGVRTRALPTVSLGREQTASAVLEWISGPVAGLSCSSVSYFKITPPGAYRALRGPLAGKPFAVCQAVIHPVVSGLDGGAGQ